MSQNTFGRLLTLTSFGESHGVAIGGVVDGCPPGMALDQPMLQKDLERRRTSKSRYTSQRREPDQVELLSGVFEGYTTGSPIAFMIRNQDQRESDYKNLKDTFRPNHADYVYEHKYGRRDYRGGGRSSARETAVRVAGGAIARQFLQGHGIAIRACLCGLGPFKIQCHDWESVTKNPFFCPDPKMVPELEQFMQALIKSGDSIGAELYLEAQGVPAGLGAPVYSRLDADIAAAMMGINAVKAVGIGDGVSVATQKGSEHRDEMSPKGFLSNHSGGVVGGISTGQNITVKVSFKPTSSIRLPGKSIDRQGKPVIIETTGRHDPCVGLRAVPIVEAMMALLLADHFLLHRAQNAEVQSEIPLLPGTDES